MPALSFHFGITGDDVIRMPIGELNEYLKALNEVQAAIAKQGR